MRQSNCSEIIWPAHNERSLDGRKDYWQTTDKGDYIGPRLVKRKRILTPFYVYLLKPNLIQVLGGPKGKAWWRDSAYSRAWKRELNGKIVLFREWSIWHPAWLGKLRVNRNFKQFLGVICAKNLHKKRDFEGPIGKEIHRKIWRATKISWF